MSASPDSIGTIALVGLAIFLAVSVWLSWRKSRRMRRDERDRRE